ncbi:MAG TPA: response regulator [Gemmataceae bacterium]
MTDSAPRRRRVLVAAVTADEAESLRALLSVWGCDVRTVTDGATVVAAAKAFRPGVALLDLRLDGTDGTDVARRLRSSPDLGRVTLVALAGRGAARRAHTPSDEFDHLLTLPVDPEALRRIAVG